MDSFVPDFSGYDAICLSDEVCDLLETAGEHMADKANDLASPKRGDTPYFATKAFTDNGHRAVVFVENADNHGYWDNKKHKTLNKVRKGGDVI